MEHKIQYIKPLIHLQYYTKGCVANTHLSHLHPRSVPSATFKSLLLLVCGRIVYSHIATYYQIMQENQQFSIYACMPGADLWGFLRFPETGQVFLLLLLLLLLALYSDQH